MTKVAEQKMIQLLAARFPQSVIVSELVAGSLCRRQGFGVSSCGCVLAAAATFSVPHNWIDAQLAQNVIQHTLWRGKAALPLSSAR
jgi:hypothetical protein